MSMRSTKLYYNVIYDLISIFERLTRLFRNSLLDIVVDSRNAEQVIALIGNIFSYQIQRFYRESDLRRIHLRNHGRHSYTEVYVSEDDKKVPDEFNLYELYQTLTALLLASARLETPNMWPLRFAGTAGDGKSELTHYQFSFVKPKVLKEI